MLAENDTQASWPCDVLQERARGGGLLIQYPGHTCAGIEQHANVEDHIAVVSKEFNGLLLPIFEHTEFTLVKLAGYLLPVIAHAEVQGNQVDALLDNVLLAGLILRKTGHR